MPRSIKKGPFVDHDRGHFQLVDVRALVVLCVGNSGKQDFLDDVRSLLVAEREQLLGLFDRQTPHLVGNEADFLRRNARVSQSCSHLHGNTYFVLRSPE